MSKCNNCYHNKVCIDGANNKTAESCKHYVPAADVQEKKDCEKCIHFSRHATEYPCNYCRNCYTDKFQPMPNCGARMDGKDGEE